MNKMMKCDIKIEFEFDRKGEMTRREVMKWMKKDLKRLVKNYHDGIKKVVISGAMIASNKHQEECNDGRTIKTNRR